MEFGVLGPVEIREADRLIDAGHARQRAVLAVLLLELGRSVPAATLIDRVWGDAPPASVRNVLYGYVARLRAALARASDARASEASVTLSRRSGGYLLQARPEQLDLVRFRQLAAEAAAADSDEQAATVLSGALGLWRGPALAGLDSPWLGAMRTTLELERHAAQLDLNDVRLRLSQHAALAGELTAQAAATPTDERLAGQLMLALYRSGHPAESLRHYDQTRRHLATELGADPGPELQALHRQILTSDPALTAPPPVTATATGTRTMPVPRELPPDVAAFTGRSAELAALDRLLLPTAGGPGSAATAAVISAVSGTAGVGKTALALHWAHRAAAHFPDGQLHVNLRGYDPEQPVSAADALASFLRALGTPGTDIPADETERAARYRSQLADKRSLILLDNAATADQVRPLLPGNPACRVLVTSRDSLAGLVARDGAARLDLDLLPLGEATALLRELIGARADADPAATAELADQCARLPLALRVAAELATSRPAAPLAALVAGLADQQARLDQLDAAGDSRTAVRAVFSWSYDHLEDGTARLFRLAGLHPGPDLDVYAVAALAASCPEEAGRAIESLTRAHLLQPTGPGRYSMHDLLRAYARDLASAHDSEDEAQAANTRLFDYYLSTAATAMDTLYPAQRHRRPRNPASSTAAPQVSDADSALAWLDRECANFVALATYGARNHLPRHTTRLSTTVGHYLQASGHYSEALIIHSRAREAAGRTGDRAAEGGAMNSLGIVHRSQGDYRQAAGYLEQALVLFRQAGDRAGQARALSNLGNLYCRQGQYKRAADSLQDALAIFRDIDDSLGEALALDSLGAICQLEGRYELAGGHLSRALALHRLIGDLNGEAYALHNLGIVYQRQGSHRDAADSLQQALALFRQSSDRSGEAAALVNLGAVNLGQQRLSQADLNMREALALAREIGDRSGEADAQNGLGDIALANGQPLQARISHSAALGVALQIGDSYQQALAHRGLGSAHHSEGDISVAREHWQHALALFSELGASEAGEVGAQLAALSDC